MNCFNEEQIQHYIDNESAAAERDAFRQHMEICPVCRNALTQQQHRWLEVKQSLDLLVTQQPQIPTFRATKKAKSQKNIPIKYLWPLAVAAGLLLLVLLRPFNSADPLSTNGLNHQYVVYEEIDANKPITEHPLIMTVVAPDGTVSQTSIN
jgi:hypothetical protein